MGVTCRRRWFGILASIVQFLVLLANIPFVAGQTCKGAGKPPTPSDVVSSEIAGATRGKPHNWSEADDLPLLAQAIIRPINPAEFSADIDEGFSYPRQPGPLHATEKPFEHDDDAVAAARSWITAKFGRLPQGVSLGVDRIDHSSSGRPEPAFGWDQGHTIVFREIYCGIPTDSGVVIYIAGKTKYAASVKLHAYSSIPGTAKRIVGKAAAVKAWEDRIKQKGYDATLLAQFGYQKNLKPRLVYVWSPKYNVGGRSNVVAPTWELGRDCKCMVDGQSGIAWLND
jgi:hypothetical protein